MLNYFLRRLALTIPTFFALMFVTFVAIRLVPGDPVEVRVGEHGISPERLAYFRHELGLDLPVWRQFLDYAWRILHGDFGVSLATQQKVLTEFLTLFPATIELSVCAMMFAVLVGVPAGAVAAVKEVVRAFNGEIVKLAEGDAHIIGELAHGRRYLDGAILIDSEETCIAERRKLGFAGVVSIAIAITAKGELAGDPDVLFAGLPQATREGAGVDALIDAAIFETFESLPRQNGAIPISSPGRLNVPSAPPSTTSGARSRRCMCWWWRCDRQ